MDIEIIGKPRAVSIDEIHYATQWITTYLIGNRITSSLYLTLKFTNLKDLNGNCIWVGDNNRPREFEIEISNKLGYKPTMSALAHELVHVKQYAKGELKDYMVHKWCRWKDEIFQVDDIDYWEAPWEIEAFGREVGLVHKYRLHCKEKGITF